MRSCVRASVRVSFQDPYSMWVVWVSVEYTDNHQVFGGSSQDLHCKNECREERWQRIQREEEGARGLREDGTEGWSG